MASALSHIVYRTGSFYMNSHCYVCSVLGILFHYVVLCIVCVKMCTVLLPPGVNPIAVNKYHINIGEKIINLLFYFLKDAHKILTSLPLTHYCLTDPNIFPRITTFLFAIRTGVVELVRNLMAHAQKPDFVFRLNGRVH